MFTSVIVPGGQQSFHLVPEPPLYAFSESCLPGDVLCLSNLDNIEEGDELLPDVNGDGPGGEMHQRLTHIG